MIENILIIDTETTGLDPAKGAKMIELGAILYNVKHKVILQNFSTLFKCDANPVQDINNISPEATQCKMPMHFIVPMFIQMADHAQALVAHNAQFDKKFIDTIEPKPAHKFSERKWICTRSDFNWPVTLYRNRLQDVCVAMGVPYVEAHRALNDCNLIAQCFTKVQDLQVRINAGKKNQFSNSARYV